MANFFTCSHVNYIDDACREILKAAVADGERVSVYNIDLSGFYGAKFIPNVGMDICYENVKLRNTTTSVNIWKSPLGRQELREALYDLWKILDSIRAENKISAALIADDVGSFEKLFILFCNFYQIPVVHWVHGIEFSSEKKTLHTSGIEGLQSADDCVEEALMVLPCGFNGSKYICANSLLDKIKLIHNGILPHQIFLTGNPSLDFRDRKSIKKKQKNAYSKIIYISTGYAKFADYICARSAYDFLLAGLVYIDQSKFRISIRLKPGENFEDIDPLYAKKFADFNVEILNNTISIEEQIDDFDIVLVDKSSVCLKSLILKKPTVLIKIKEIEKKYGLCHFETLNLLYIEDVKFFNNVFECALAPEYAEFQDAELRKNEELLFFKIDGLAHKRIADVIRQAIAAPKSGPNYKAHPRHFSEQEVFPYYRTALAFLAEPAIVSSSSQIRANLLKKMFKFILPYGVVRFLQKIGSRS